MKIEEVMASANKIYGKEIIDQKKDIIMQLLVNCPELEYLENTEAEIRNLINDMIYPRDENNLALKYIVPPLSIFDTKNGDWQKRKRQWINKMGDIGETEKNLLAFSSLLNTINSGTSYFDPVLAEIIVSWYCPKGGKILNPFCGEATVGAACAMLGHDFIGIEIRPEQVEKNRKIMEKNNMATSRFLCGDSQNLDKILIDNKIDYKFDLIFSSPPYYDLEIYSSKSGDISNMPSYQDFMKMYNIIFEKAVANLKQDRFLVVKVSEVRNKKTGAYYNFVGDNIACFLRLGLHYINEIILLNAIGTACMRASMTFRNRKVVRTHQNVLVFYKGNMENIQKNFPPQLESVIDFESYKQDMLF